MKYYTDKSFIWIEYEKDLLFDFILQFWQNY